MNSKSLQSPQTAGNPTRLARFLPWLLIVCGLIGIIASVAITAEKFDLLANPSYHPICDLNPIISCGSVMQSKQANAFGFMNTYIGLIGFPVLVTIGAALLAGARFKRWFWLGLQAGLGLGIVFAYWLLFESVYRIQALCPYCLSVDIVITVAFWYVTLYNLRLNITKHARKIAGLSSFLQRHHLDILLLWCGVILALILNHFWYYFGPHLFHLG